MCVCVVRVVVAPRESHSERKPVLAGCGASAVCLGELLHLS